MSKSMEGLAIKAIYKLGLESWLEIEEKSIFRALLVNSLSHFSEYFESSMLIIPRATFIRINIQIGSIILLAISK